MVFFDKDPLLNTGNVHGAVSAMSPPSKARLSVEETLSVQETPTIRWLTASTKECQTQTHAELATKEVEENTLKKDSFQDNEVVGDDTDQDDAPFEFDDCIDDDNDWVESIPTWTRINANNMNLVEYLEAVWTLTSILLMKLAKKIWFH